MKLSGVLAAVGLAPRMLTQVALPPAARAADRAPPRVVARPEPRSVPRVRGAL